MPEIAVFWIFLRFTSFVASDLIIYAKRPIFEKKIFVASRARNVLKTAVFRIFSSNFSLPFVSFHISGLLSSSLLSRNLETFTRWLLSLKSRAWCWQNGQSVTRLNYIEWFKFMGVSLLQEQKMNFVLNNENCIALSYGEFTSFTWLCRIQQKSRCSPPIHHLRQCPPQLESVWLMLQRL